MRAARRSATPSAARKSHYGVEEVDPAGRFTEGATTSILVNAFERNPKARAECLRHYGPKCVACDVEMDSIYGPIAEGVDPVKDLRPLCPNCHAVVHLSDPPMHVADLRKLMRSQRRAG